MSDGASEVRVKGVTVLGLVKLLKKRCSEAEVQEVLDRLPAEDREVFADRILISSWYPYRTFHSLLVAIDEVLGEGDGQVADDIGKTSAEMDLTGVYRSILSFLNPGFVTKRALSAWKNYYSHGTWEVVEEQQDGERRLLRIRLKDFATLSRTHCRNIRGWCEKFVELVGGKQITVQEVGCHHRGGECCEFVLSWSENDPEQV